MTTSEWFLLAWFGLQFKREQRLSVAGPSLAWPVRGVISSPFGRRKHPVTGESQFHHGVDVACPVGSPVFAPVDGIVERSFSESGGYTATLRGDHCTFRFHHLQPDSFTSGGPINFAAGEIIARTGQSGRVTGPHVHIEVFVGPPGSMERVDPCKFFRSPSPERLVVK